VMRHGCGKHLCVLKGATETEVGARILGGTSVDR
jgi:hypothetical protein